MKNIEQYDLHSICIITIFLCAAMGAGLGLGVAAFLGVLFLFGVF